MRLRDHCGSFPQSPLRRKYLGCSATPTGPSSTLPSYPAFTPPSTRQRKACRPSRRPSCRGTTSWRRRAGVGHGLESERGRHGHRSSTCSAGATRAACSKRILRFPAIEDRQGDDPGCRLDGRAWMTCCCGPRSGTASSGATGGSYGAVASFLATSPARELRPGEPTYLDPAAPVASTHCIVYDASFRAAGALGRRA